MLAIKKIIWKGSILHEVAKQFSSETTAYVDIGQDIEENIMLNQ